MKKIVKNIYILLCASMVILFTMMSCRNGNGNSKESDNSTSSSFTGDYIITDTDNLSGDMEDSSNDEVDEGIKEGEGE